MYIPLFLAAFGIILRGSSYAFRPMARGTWLEWPSAVAFGVASITNDSVSGSRAFAAPMTFGSECVDAVSDAALGVAAHAAAGAVGVVNRAAGGVRAANP